MYQVDHDGEWGEIRFDFATGTAEIVRLAEWDTIKSNVFARTAISVHTELTGGKAAK